MAGKLTARAGGPDGGAGGDEPRQAVRLHLRGGEARRAGVEAGVIADGCGRAAVGAPVGVPVDVGESHIVTRPDANHAANRPGGAIDLAARISVGEVGAPEIGPAIIGAELAYEAAAFAPALRLKSNDFTSRNNGKRLSRNGMVSARRAAFGKRARWCG